MVGAQGANAGLLLAAEPSITCLILTTSNAADAPGPYRRILILVIKTDSKRPNEVFMMTEDWSRTYYAVDSVQVYLMPDILGKAACEADTCGM